MNELQLLLLVAAIALAIGVAIGALISWLLTSASNKPAVVTKEKIQGEQLRVWRDPGQSRVVVGIKGERAITVTELSPGALDSLRKTLEELRRWAGFLPETPSAEVSAPVPSLEPLPSPYNAPAAESKPERIGPVDVFARALRTEVRKPEPPASSIAAQIDEIVQEKLAADPSINRAVRLIEIPGKGMVVMVGLNQYAGVDEVPDADVRALIHEAVAEWERRVEN